MAHNANTVLTALGDALTVNGFEQPANHVTSSTDLRVR